MDKNISEEKIEIGGVEYTLFLNRTGIVNWEKMTKLDESAEKYGKLSKQIEQEKEIVINDDTNPFEIDGITEEEIDKNIDEMIEIYVKFYWVALYTHHKFSLSKARELFNLALEDYGIDQLAQLANQMIADANTNRFNNQRKNLKALKSTQTN